MKKTIIMAAMAAFVAVAMVACNNNKPAEEATPSAPDTLVVINQPAVADEPVQPAAAPAAKKETKATKATTTNKVEATAAKVEEAAKEAEKTANTLERTAKTVETSSQAINNKMESALGKKSKKEKKSFGK